MPLHVVNWKYAQVLTAVAAADMDQGQVCAVGGTGANRELTPLADTDDALVLAGNYAIAMKVSTDPAAVDESDAPARLGSRLNDEISTGDLIMECRRGSLVRYTADLLDDSLNPAALGTTPAIGDDLGIAGGKPATIAAATSSGIATPVVMRVHNVVGTDVIIELL